MMTPRSNLTYEQANELATHLRTLRPDWQRPGILAALDRAAHRDDHPEYRAISHAAITAANNPQNRTPAVIPLDGAHWRSADPAPNGQYPSGPLPECANCGQPAKRYDVEGEGPTRKVTPHPPPKRCPGCGEPWKPVIVQITGQDLHATQQCQICKHIQAGRFPFCSNCGAEITTPKPEPVAARPHLDDPVPIAETIWDTLGQIHERQARATQEPWSPEEAR